MVATKHPAAWQDAAARLEEEGWHVECRKVWLAEARRGTHVQQGVGATREGAVEELVQMAHLDGPDGCP